MSKYSKKNPLNQIYQAVLAMALIILITITISLLATATAEQQAMRRESIPVQGVVILSLDQALNESLAAGDYRRVNVDWEEVI